MQETSSAVVINRNGIGYLRESLGSLQAASFRFSEYIFVDDASEDGSAEFVAENFPFFRILRTGRRRGPAAARNIGLAAASSRRIFFMDGDVALEEGCLEALLSELKAAPGPCSAFPRVRVKGGPVQYGPGRVNCLGLSVFEDFWADPAACGVDPGAGAYSAGSSAAFFLTIPAPRFDEDYFSHGEDTDFFLRFAMAGGRLLYVRRAAVLHLNGRLSAGGVRPDKAADAEKNFYQAVNRRLTLLKCFSAGTLLLTLPAQAVYELLALGDSARRGLLAGYLKGVWRTFLAAPGTMRKRKELFAVKCRPDRQLLSPRGVQARPGALPRRSYSLLLGWCNIFLHSYCAACGFTERAAGQNVSIERCPQP
jgi:GT2 family glycosyltransferase